MSSEDQLCGNCKLKSAEFFCSDTEPKNFLCDSCLPQHTGKVSRQGHQSWLLPFLSLHKNPRYFESYTLEAMTVMWLDGLVRR